MKKKTVSRIVKKNIIAMIESGEFKEGDELPSYLDLSKKVGGSPKSVMPAILELEHEGVLVRISPRKIAVARRSSSDENIGPWLSLPVGLINFGGHVFEDMGSDFIRRLYDRKIPTAAMMPIGNSEIELSRWCKRFFENEFRALIIRDGIGIPVRNIEKYYGNIQKLIIIANPFNIWEKPHSGVYIDRAFCAYDALCRLRDAGCQRIHVLAGGNPPGAINPRDSYESGYKSFIEENSRRNIKCFIESPYEMLSKNELIRKWTAGLKKGDGVYSESDFYIIKAHEWVSKYSTLDYRELVYIGTGNTPWSQHGVLTFPSYDLRTEDTVDMVLQIIDSKDDETIERRIKPHFVREELLK